MTELTAFDIGALTVCIFALAAYHTIFYYVQRSAGTQYSFNIRNVAHWLHKHKEKSDPQSATLAVHTLRNTIMVGVFIGGYALNVAYNSASNYSDEKNKRMQVRAVCLAILLFGSFLCWAIVIRYAAQLGYLIGTLDFEDKSDLEVLNHLPGHDEATQISGASDTAAFDASERTKARALKYPFDKKIAVKTSEHILQSLLFYFSLGFRFLFVSIPFAFYVYGPLALVIATAGIVAFSYHYDYCSYGASLHGM